MNALEHISQPGKLPLPSGRVRQVAVEPLAALGLMCRVSCWNVSQSPFGVMRYILRWMLLGAILIAFNSCNVVEDVVQEVARRAKEAQGASERPDPQYLPEAPKPVPEPLPAVGAPGEAPFVGREGTDEDGYPLRRPDQAELNRLLRAKQFEAVESHFDHYQEAFEQDFKKEYWPADALLAFRDADPTLAKVLNEWVEQFPQSPYARAARARQRTATGWHFRGSKTVGKTSNAQFDTFKEHLQEAIEDLKKAVELRPTYTAAWVAWLSNAQLVGAGAAQQRVLLNKALESCPACFRPPATVMLHLTPRWGGSYDAMRAAAREAMDKAPQNPRLARLPGLIAADRCSALVTFQKKPAAAEPHCQKALEFGFDPLFASASMRLLRHQGKKREAAEIATKILEKTPHYPKALYVRSDFLSSQEDYQGAARDLIVLRQLDAANESLGKRARWLVDHLRYQGDQLRKQNRSDEAAEYFQLALTLNPQDSDLRNRMAHADQGHLEALKKKVAAHPDDFDLHLRLDGALAVQKRFPEIISMWDAYISRSPRDARAYYERGGAKGYNDQEVAAARDVVMACRLGMARACSIVQRHNLKAIVDKAP